MRKTGKAIEIRNIMSVLNNRPDVSALVVAVLQLPEHERSEAIKAALQMLNRGCDHDGE